MLAPPGEHPHHDGGLSNSPAPEKAFLGLIWTSSILSLLAALLLLWTLRTIPRTRRNLTLHLIGFLSMAQVGSCVSWFMKRPGAEVDGLCVASAGLGLFCQVATFLLCCSIATHYILTVRRRGSESSAARRAARTAERAAPGLQRWAVRHRAYLTYGAVCFLVPLLCAVVPLSMGMFVRGGGHPSDIGCWFDGERFAWARLLFFDSWIVLSWFYIGVVLLLARRELNTIRAFHQLFEPFVHNAVHTRRIVHGVLLNFLLCWMWSSILALLSLIDDIQTVFGGVAASGSGSGSSPSGPLSAAQVMMVILLLAFGIFSPLQGFLNLLLMLARSPLFLQGFRLMAVRAVPGWLLPLAGRALRLPPMPEYVDALSSEERAQAWRAHLVEAIGPLDLSADEKITGQVPELGIEAASLLPSPQTKFSPLLPGLGGSVDPFVGGPSRGVTLGNDEYTPLMMAGHQASGAGGFGGGGPGSGSSWHQDAPAGAPFSPAELGLVLGEPLAGTALPPGAESPSISLPAEPGSRGVSAPEVEDPLLEALSWVVHVAPACFDRAGGLAELPAAEPGRPRPMGLMASSLRARYAQSTASPCLLFCFGRRPDEHPLPLASYTGQRLTAMVSGAAPDHPLILRVTLQQCLLRARSGDAPVEAPGLTFICSGPGRALPGVLSRRLSRYRLLYWDVAVADTLAGVGSRVAEVPVTVAPARAIAGVRRADPAVAHSGSLRTGLQHAHERLLRTWAAGQAASSPGLPSPAVLSRRLSTLSTTPMGTSPAPRAVSLSPVSRPLAAAWPAGMATPAASMSASVADRHSDSDISWSSDAYSSEEDSDGDHPAAYPAIDADSHGQDSQLALGPSSLAPPLAGWPAARSPALAFPPVPAGRPVFDLIFRRSHSFSDFTEQAIINESPWPGGAPAAGGRPRSRSIS